MAEQPVRYLRGVIFQTVVESTLRDVRRRVYRNLRTGPTTPVLLLRSGGEAERHEFDRVQNDTELGRCVRAMAEEYIEMKEYHLEVGSFEFVPHGRRGERFDLVVMFHNARINRNG